MSYLKWFIIMGCKKYLIPFLLGIVITGAMLFHNDELLSAPKLIFCLSWFTIIGFDIGIVYHSYLTYKADTFK